MTVQDDIEKLQSEYPKLFRQKTRAQIDALKRPNTVYQKMLDKIGTIREYAGSVAPESVGAESVKSVRWEDERGFYPPNLKEVQPKNNLRSVLKKPEPQFPGREIVVSDEAGPADGPPILTLDARKRRLKAIMLRKDLLEEFGQMFKDLKQFDIDKIQTEEEMNEYEHTVQASLGRLYGRGASERFISAMSRSTEFVLDIPDKELQKITQNDTALKQDVEEVIGGFASAVSPVIRASFMFVLDTADAFFNRRVRTAPTANGIEKPLTVIHE